MLQDQLDSIFFQLSEERFTWMFQQGDYYFQCPGNVTDYLIVTLSPTAKTQVRLKGHGMWHK
jgi:hypothetical protein